MLLRVSGSLGTVCRTKWGFAVGKEIGGNHPSLLKGKCPSLERTDGFAGGMAVRMQPYITGPDI